MARLDQDAAGRLLERAGDRTSRGMTIPAERPDRTRLTGANVYEAPGGAPAGGFTTNTPTNYRWSMVDGRFNRRAEAA